MAKRCLRWGITVVLAIHVLLVIDCPVVCVAASALTHASYLRLTKTYPFISSMSLPFCASAGTHSSVLLFGSACHTPNAGLMIISQVLWMRHFHHTEHSLEYILCFFTTTGAKGVRPDYVAPSCLFLHQLCPHSVGCALCHFHQHDRCGQHPSFACSSTVCGQVWYV